CTYSGLLLAQSGHRPLHCTRPLLRVKRTSRFALHVSAFDPKRTWHRSWTLIQYQGLARTVIAATCDTAFWCAAVHIVCSRKPRLVAWTSSKGILAFRQMVAMVHWKLCFWCCWF